MRIVDQINPEYTEYTEYTEKDFQVPA